MFLFKKSSRSAPVNILCDDYAIRVDDKVLTGSLQYGTNFSTGPLKGFLNQMRGSR